MQYDGFADYANFRVQLEATLQLSAKGSGFHFGIKDLLK